MLPEISQKTLNSFRDRTFHALNGRKVTSQDQAVEFINQRGMVLFWPARDVIFPSLWAAVAGDRRVPNDHDDPGHVTWGWKDNLLDKQLVYYARVIRRRNTFISFDCLPFFYALSPNYGSPDEDYLIDYEAGRLSAEAKTIYETLLQEGPLDTITLRKSARMTSRGSDNAFNKALEILQTTFRILPVGVAHKGAWNYAFIYSLTTHQYPWLPEKAHPIGEWDARRNLIQVYLRAAGACSRKELARIFSWSADTTDRSLRKLIESRVLIECTIEGVKDPAVVLADIN